MFDTLKYVKELEGSGLTTCQAEGFVRIIVEILEANVATKQDLDHLRIDLKTDIHGEIAQLRNELYQLETRMTIKVVALVIATVGAITGIMNFVNA